MKLGKWGYELIIVAVLVVVGLGIWWFVATKDERLADVQLEQLVKFANRQAVEIAIIKQTGELEHLKKAYIESRKPTVP